MTKAVVPSRSAASPPPPGALTPPSPQRKRVNIAMELVARPACIMLDEPTSGLDSSTAHMVIIELRSLTTTTACTALAVIHQPRWETLMLFDQLILLAPGGPYASVQHLPLPLHWSSR